jgi:methyl acetate hydrolase
MQLPPYVAATDSVQRTCGLPYDAIFPIASMTKPIASVCALRLVEQGVLTLDEPLPELAHAQVLDGGRLRPPRRPITLRHLLTHTAGFGYSNWDPDLKRWAATADDSSFRAAPLVFDPGERWKYGVNIDWVGEVVARRGGATLAEQMAEHVFAPLGMLDTAYGVPPEKRSRVAPRWRRRPNGGLDPEPFDVPTPGGSGVGGGGLYSTADDYLRFLRGFPRLLRPDTLEAMVQNQIGELTVEPLPIQAPENSNDFELFPGQPKKWGLAGMLTADGRWRWAGLYNTYFWCCPGGVVLTNVLPFGDPAVLDLASAFEKETS